MALSDKKIAVVGLGYVGLPLAVYFASKYNTVGYDLKHQIIDNCRKSTDPTGEVSEEEFAKAVCFHPTNDPRHISDADFVIIAVPTPIDRFRKPDLTFVETASDTVGKHMKKGVVVIFESTVYPGVTEEICVPIMEKASGFKWQRDFNVGYSPERINPGDKEHTLPKIVKVVAGDNPKTLEKVAVLYESIIDAGVYKTETIKEAEAAKVIENTQRDLNIALMNELALIFNKLNIDTKNVLDAARSKWNFLPFTPGLVGGHCIGVDPYYLTFKAESEGYHPEMILAGRRINDHMAGFVVEKTVKLLINKGFHIKGDKVGILGLTFKENCPDLRNTKVVDMISQLESYGTEIVVHDPIADPEEAKAYYNVRLSDWNEIKNLSALILAVPHRRYRDLGFNDFAEKVSKNGYIIDIKSMFTREQAKHAAVNYWRL